MSEPDPGSALAWLYRNADVEPCSKVLKRRLRHRPFTHYPGRCVYWVELNAVPMYVGQTRYGVRERLKEHRHQKDSAIHDLIRSAETTVHWIPVSTSSSLDDFENSVIRLLHPKLNIRIPK